MIETGKDREEDREEEREIDGEGMLVGKIDDRGEGRIKVSGGGELRGVG